MSRIRSALAVLALVSVSAALPSRAAAGPHPLFDDAGTLDWYTSLSAAQAAAEAEGKLIFIDSGRLHCPNCRSLISQVLPSGSVRSRIAAVAVGLADDADESDPRVQAILESGVPGAPTLPIVGFVTANLRWVTGWYGYAGESEVCAHLAVAEQRLTFWKRKRLEAREAACPPKPLRLPVSAPAPVPTPPPDLRSKNPAPVIVAKPTPVPPPSFPTRADETPRVVAKAAPPAPAPTSLPPAERKSVAVVPPAPKPASTACPTGPAPAIDPCAGGSCKAPVRVAPTLPPPKARIAARETPKPAGIPTPAPSPRPAATSSTSGSRARTLLLAAQSAATTGSWKEVLRVSEAAAALPRDGDTLEIALLGQKAQRWALDSLQQAADGASLGRYGQAITVLEAVRREMAGRLQEIDAERGERAVEQRISIERGSPDDATDLEQMRRRAYSEYRGTRWAALFKPSRSSTADAPAIVAPR